jgi:hypothetical protein
MTNIYRAREREKEEIVNGEKKHLKAEEIG